MRRDDGEEEADEVRSLRIRADQALSIGRRAGPRVIRCGSGVVWVTQEGDSRDYVLGAGEEVRIESPGAVVLQSIRDASVLVLELRRRRTG